MLIFEDRGQNKGQFTFSKNLNCLSVWRGVNEVAGVSVLQQPQIGNDDSGIILDAELRICVSAADVSFNVPVKRFLPIYLLDWFLNVQTEDVSGKPLGNECRVSLTDVTKTFKIWQNQFPLLKWGTIIWLALTLGRKRTRVVPLAVLRS